MVPSGSPTIAGQRSPGAAAKDAPDGRTTQPGSSVLEIASLKKHFRLANERVVTAVDNITLNVEAGEFVVLLGPSGCGKTTLLRTVAGLERPDSGRIAIGGRTVYDSAAGVHVPVEKRELSMVFQSYALWPHMKAAANVGYPLKARGVARGEIAERVSKVLELVGVADQANRYPNQMSGGQQQRVALARALVAETDLILFDEPLSNIDAKVREQLRVELLEMQRSIGFTALYVTHDQAEAMQLAHRIAVLDNGNVAQLADGRTIYDRPVSRYVARFVGRANELAGSIVGIRESGPVVSTALGTGNAVADDRSLAEGESVSVVWRPENCAVVRADQPVDSDAALHIEGSVGACTYVGMHTELIVRAGDQTLLAIASPSSTIGEGDAVRLSVEPGRLLVLPRDDVEVPR